MDTTETVSSAQVPYWIAEFQELDGMTARDAASILAGVNPHGSVRDLSDEEAVKVDSFGKALAAAASLKQLDPEGMWGPNSPNLGDIRDGLWRYDTVRLSHADIRAWCQANGFHWPVPEAIGVRTLEPRECGANEWQLFQLPDAQEKRTDAERHRDEAESEVSLLRAQVAEMQKTIDELRRIAGDGSAAALHNTALMKIALQVQRDYWRNPNDPPKQETLINELMEKYGLSKFEASSVERVACPVDRKKASKN